MTTENSDLAQLLKLARDLPGALQQLAYRQFDDLQTVEAFYELVKHLYPTIGRLRRHISTRDSNGLARMGAVIERVGHPLLVRPSLFFKWIASSEPQRDVPSPSTRSRKAASTNAIMEAFEGTAERGCETDGPPLARRLYRAGIER
jgi:hypothetical protein